MKAAINGRSPNEMANVELSDLSFGHSGEIESRQACCAVIRVIMSW